MAMRQISHVALVSSFGNESKYVYLVGKHKGKLSSRKPRRGFK